MYKFNINFKIFNQYILIFFIRKLNIGPPDLIGNLFSGSNYNKLHTKSLASGSLVA